MAEDCVIHVIDDDKAMRNSLSFLLRAAKLEVRSYDSAEAFLSDSGNHKHGCIVSDVRMPEMDGIELLRRIKAMAIDLPVIIITGHGDVSLAVEAMKAGAVDFLEKPFEEKQVLAAIESALQKEHGDRDTMSTEDQARVRKHLANLSARERQVLDGIVAGLPNKTIAFDLGISPRTVEVYRSNVMTKMRAKSLADLVRMTLRVSGK